MDPQSVSAGVHAAHYFREGFAVGSVKSIVVVVVIIAVAWWAYKKFA